MGLHSREAAGPREQAVEGGEEATEVAAEMEEATEEQEYFLLGAWLGQGIGYGRQ